MKSFLTRFGIILLTFLGTMAVAFLAISPIIGLLFAAQYIGYWFYVLLPVALAFAVALIWSIIVYIAKSMMNNAFKVKTTLKTPCFLKF